MTTKIQPTNIDPTLNYSMNQLTANTILDGGVEIILVANSAFIQANAAFTQANTATNNAAGASLYANAAFTQANAVFNYANTLSTSSTSLDTANKAYIQSFILMGA